MNTDIKMIAMGCKPDPTKFIIKDIKLVCGNTIILANYTGCKTFNGDKLMVLKGNWNVNDFETLDPHFLDEDYAVVARFIPTKLGMKLAKEVAKSL